MDLKIILKEAFPLMDDDKIQNIHGSISRMIKDHQLSVEDLKYLEATDLFPYLELFQARKLINIIKEKENESSQIQHNPNSHSFCHTQTLSCNLNDTVNTTAEDRTKSINWSRIPKKLMKDLERKKRPTPTNRKALVRYFIDDILDSHENPGRKTLAKFAENIVSTYPDSLADQISKNGDVIGDGSYSLLIQMDNRVRNVKRKRKEIQN